MAQRFGSDRPLDGGGLLRLRRLLLFAGCLFILGIGLGLLGQGFGGLRGGGIFDVRLLQRLGALVGLGGRFRDRRLCTRRLLVFLQRLLIAGGIGKDIGIERRLIHRFVMRFLGLGRGADLD